ncbi:MAG: hypothetical protein ACI4KF_09870 [Huintestinicola sp.]
MKLNKKYKDIMGMTQRALPVVLAVLLSACSGSEDSAKQEAESLRAELESIKAETSAVSVTTPEATTTETTTVPTTVTTTEPTTTTPSVVRTELTADNIGNYLGITMGYDDSSYSYSVQFDTFYYHSIDAYVSTTPLDFGYFENAIIEIEYKMPAFYSPSDADYAYVDEDTLRVKFILPQDGRYTEYHNISASGMEGWGGSLISKPTAACDWRIISVSGEFVSEQW